MLNFAVKSINYFPRVVLVACTIALRFSGHQVLPFNQCLRRWADASTRTRFQTQGSSRSGLDVFNLTCFPHYRHLQRLDHANASPMRTMPTAVRSR